MPNNYLKKQKHPSPDECILHQLTNFDISSLYGLPVLRRGHSVGEKKIAVEARGGLETDGECDLIHRHVGFSQQTCGFLQTKVTQVLAKSLVICQF